MMGHQAPITGLSVHPGASQNDKRLEMTNLLLTSSMDWTIKLWNPEKEKTPLFSFESSHDWIYDVQWSPKHPSVFASVGNSGQVDIWNINQNKEFPVAHWPEEEDRDKPYPLNCVRWSADGRRLLTGDSMGHVTLF